MAEKANQKLVDRVRKLLALANDAGATEAEAASAAEHARRIMAENGITNATVEASGGEGEARVKDGRKGHTGKRWMRDIMEALCEQSFVMAYFEEGKRDAFTDTLKPGRWELYGRESAVVTVKIMHEYLVRSVDRVAREVHGKATDETFKRAMGERIAERLEERHSTAMHEQAQQARQSNESRGDSSNALVVVLEDYAQKERDLNTDLIYGLAPGTTAERRRQQELERLRRNQEYEAEQEKRARRRKEMRAQGLDDDVIDLIMSGISKERAMILAEKQHAAKPKQETEEQRVRREERAEREWRKYQERERSRSEREAARRSHPSYRAGRRAGDSIGLDTQVSTGAPKRSIT